VTVQTEEVLMQQAKKKIDEHVADINRVSQDAANSGLLDKEKYVVPPHLHDLQESDLPETQRGLVISEIAQFRERAAKREREKMRDVQASIPVLTSIPSGPKAREWGKSQSASPAGKQGYGKTAQNLKGFVKAEDGGKDETPRNKTDEELEQERKQARRRDEEVSCRDVSCTALKDRPPPHSLQAGTTIRTS